jgi:hypothetical protein
MKLSPALALACLALVSACNTNLPEPLLPNSHKFSTGMPVPTKYVHVEYPTDCPSYVGEASAKLAYTLEPDGSVSNVRRLEEKPAGCGFANAFMYSFKKWRFAPKIENGVAVRAVDQTCTYAWTFN